MPLATGTRLGPYEIIAPLGAGGMGEVYRARDTRLERTVAIKILPPHLSSDPVRKQRFEREAKIISGLNHPHICVLHDIGHQDGIDYLVMECLEGETLAKRLEKGPLPLDQVLKYGAQIADALDKAHRSGVVHRDLKPANIMFTPNGAKLLDFGLAKPVFRLASLATLTVTNEESPVTEDGTIVGTFQYMSPEQVEGKELDGRSDIFSLGATVYEMATGKKAFDGKSQLSVASAILERDPAPMSSVKPTTPLALEHAVKKCLAKLPEDRWQSASDLASELVWIAEVGSQAAVPSPVTARRSIGMWLAWSLATFCFLAAVVLGGGLWTRPRLYIQAIRSSLLPPPNSSFLPYSFAISPDGSRLAFVALGSDGKTTMWVRALSASTAQQLNGTEGASFPFWSSDSRQIGFFAENGLKILDLAGGAVRTLCDARFSFGGTWNRDGTILFSSELNRPLYRVQATGGVPAPVTKMPSQGSIQSYRWPLFLPDGKHFLYSVEWTSNPEAAQGNGIYTGSLDSEQSKLLLPGVTGNVLFASGYLVFARDRNLLAQPFDLEKLETTGAVSSIAEQQLDTDIARSEAGFSASQNGTLIFQSSADSPSRLVWYDQTGKELGQLPEVGFSNPEFSHDGHLLAVVSDDEHNGKHFIRVYDLKRGISTRLTDGGSEYNPIWSRDGKRIAYGGPATTSSSYQVEADGSGPPQLLLKRGMPNDWSPDGHVVFMTFAPEAHYPSVEVYSQSDQQITEFAPESVEAKFSPDGRWVAYIGAGRGIIVQPFPAPGAKLQISPGGSSQPRWSRDGKRIFYVQSDRKLMAVDFDPRHGQASAPHELFQTRIVAPFFSYWQYDVTPDGRFLINSLPSDTAAPLRFLLAGMRHCSGADVSLEVEDYAQFLSHDFTPARNCDSSLATWFLARHACAGEAREPERVSLAVSSAKRTECGMFSPVALFRSGR